jgi:hypothetical protein
LPARVAAAIHNSKLSLVIKHLCPRNGRILQVAAHFMANSS